METLGWIAILNYNRYVPKWIYSSSPHRPLRNLKISDYLSKNETKDLLGVPRSHQFEAISMPVNTAFVLAGDMFENSEAYLVGLLERGDSATSPLLSVANYSVFQGFAYWFMLERMTLLATLSVITAPSKDLIGVEQRSSSRRNCVNGKSMARLQVKPNRRAV
jgi:hypothetical protein